MWPGCELVSLSEQQSSTCLQCFWTLETFKVGGVTNGSALSAMLLGAPLREHLNWVALWNLCASGSYCTYCYILYSVLYCLGSSCRGDDSVQ